MKQRPCSAVRRMSESQEPHLPAACHGDAFESQRSRKPSASKPQVSQWVNISAMSGLPVVVVGRVYVAGVAVAGQGEPTGGERGRGRVEPAVDVGARDRATAV